MKSIIDNNIRLIKENHQYVLETKPEIITGTIQKGIGGKMWTTRKLTQKENGSQKIYIMVNLPVG